MRFTFLLAIGILIFGTFAESGRIVRAWKPARSHQISRRFYPIRTEHIPRLHHRHWYDPPPRWQVYRRPRTVHSAAFFEGISSPSAGRRYDGPTRGVGHGFPIQRDPMTHYVPPNEDDISLGGSYSGVNPRRSTDGAGLRPIRPWRRPPPPVSHISLWKLLAMKQRRRFPPRRPFPPKPHPGWSSSEEAEISPFLPNIVYFHPKDKMVPTVSTPNVSVNSSASGLKPGYVSDVPLYPTEATSPSEFKPIVTTSTRDYLLKVVNVHRPAGTSPIPETTVRSVPPPNNLDLTESYLDDLLLNPPTPINSFNINIDPSAEGSDDFIKISSSSFVETEPVEPSTTTTSTSTSTSTQRTTTTTTRKPTTTASRKMSLVATTSTTTSKPQSTTTTTTRKPAYAVRVIMPPPAPVNDLEDEQSSVISISKEIEKTSKELELKQSKIKNSKEILKKSQDMKSKEIVTKSNSGESQEKPSAPPTIAPTRPAPTFKWPTLQPYQKKKPHYPVASSKISKISSTSSSSSSTTSSETSSISIIGARSKVKEYKPTTLLQSPGLLVFDKVDTGGNTDNNRTASTTTSTIKPSPEILSASIELKSSSSTTSTVSPMQNFDPLQLIHSWLTKAKTT